MIKPLLFGLTWSTLTVFAMTYGQLYTLPDFVHVRYGIPFTFAIHTKATIAGPADLWAVDMGLLAANLIIWLAGLVVGNIFLTRGEPMRR
ncbi:MAG: hypothetical protein N3H84_06090 [Candidatus Caldarchaeum sp.]|nr:hypothetical protein [Candidatus Caldarchaeum sp.]